MLDGKFVQKKSKGSKIESAPRETTDAAVTSQSNGGFPNVSVLDTKVYREKFNLTLEGTGHQDDKFAPWQSFHSAEKAFGSNILPYARVSSSQLLYKLNAGQFLASGRDIVGIAETGSGKTLGFLLPSVWKILDTKTSDHYTRPKILVVAPTRELAMQTNVVADEMPLKNVHLRWGTKTRSDSDLEERRFCGYRYPREVAGLG